MRPLKEVINYSIGLLGSIASMKILVDLYEMKRRIINTFSEFSVVCRDMKGPLVSIIIPTRNEEKTLPKLLYSLRTQCYSNIEVVVADYASFDRTRDIARSFGARVLEVDKPGVRLCIPFSSP